MAFVGSASEAKGSLATSEAQGKWQAEPEI